MSKEQKTPTNTPTNTPIQDQFTNYELKQIEEIAREMCHLSAECKTCQICNERYHGDDDLCYFQCVAKEIINHGYRKQSEGEWQIKSEIYKMIDDVDEELYVECSICQRRFNVPYELDDEKIFKYAREHYPYCNCGAKMRKEDEGK